MKPLHFLSNPFYKAHAMKKLLPFILSGVVLGLSAAGSAQAANLLVNGSFESPNIGSAPYLDITVGSEPIGFGWTVTTNGVDIVSNGAFGSTGAMYQGVQALDLVGFGSTGGVSQSFSTTAGTQYTLSFAYANNPFNGPTSDSALVTVMDGGTSLLSQSITHSTSTYSNFNWILDTMAFTGTGDTVNLAFNTTVGSNNAGIMLDNISVSGVPVTVPEPASIVLLATGLLSFKVSRRRTNQV